MSLYKRISGRNYDPLNEVTEFDVEAASRRPFPYYTGSSRTVGFFTMGVGYLLHAMSLPAGARVVEFGAGWGNTTIAMAMSGVDVTAVDIEGRFANHYVTDPNSMKGRRHSQCRLHVGGDDTRTIRRCGFFLFIPSLPESHLPAEYSGVRRRSQADEFISPPSR